MSKTATTIIIAIIIIVAAVLLINKKPAAEQPIVETPETVTTQPEAKKMAFDVFLKQGLQGQAYECTVHQYVGEIDTVGKVWIDGEKMHGEFATAVQGQNIKSFTTMMDGYMYSWSSISNTGFKMKSTAPADANGNTSSNAASSGSYSWNASQIGDYDCKPWTPTESTFALPANIKFTEMKAS